MAGRFDVIIAGSRNFNDYDLLCEKCNFFFSRRQPSSIICGGVRGADELGKRYAEEHGIPIQMFPADWDQYGKMAGLVRNKEMLRVADAVVVFWDGQSRGSRNMIAIAKENRVPYRVVRYDKEGFDEFP